MIPKHLIESAAQATYENSPWLDAAELVPWRHLPNRLRYAFCDDARHALEAVAADLWAEGAHAMIDGHNNAWINDQNPYRASETA